MKSFQALAILFLLTISSHAYSQYDVPVEAVEEEAPKHSKYQESKWFFGGNIGLWFGSISDIEISPVVGYKFTPRLWAGGGPIYHYQRAKGYFEVNTFGGKAFTQFTVFKDIHEKIRINLQNFYIYGESQIVSTNPIYYDPFYQVYISEDRVVANMTLLGFGIRNTFGNRAGVSFMVLWTIAQSQYYPYNEVSNPLVRISFDF